MSIEYVKQDQLIFWHLKVEIVESGCKGSFTKLRGRLPARWWAGACHSHVFLC